MSLNWDWNKKCGEIEYEYLDDQGNINKNSIDLYQGNAVLIMIVQTKDEYQLFSYFADKQHMKNCLGLNKNTRNILETPYLHFTKLTINKELNRYANDIIYAFAKAYDEIDISIISNAPW